ncbi:MAG: histidine kinase, partial [Oxalicibacterium faecigallinarum]|uniref:sensor histidine kinase n=1 Tax=Oxalicibacterium faecigallinarum TaxID=573741 RepID=UPI0028077724|nr:histidine kinase [Oxalicibacterium faecigallinarum]
AYWFIILMAIPACLLALHASWRGNSISGLVLALISLCSLLLGMHDIRMHNYQISLENIYLLPLSQIGFFIVFAFIIRHRYLEGVESLERSREVLAQRLREREAELADSYARLREVERRELLSHERQRLMHDMHDGLGGSLAGMLRMMERDDCNTDGLKAALQECIDELRLTIDSLEPLESDVSVLLAGLRFRLQPRLEAAGIRLVWRVEALPLLPWLTPSHAMHVMRIVQEVVTNVVKHAEAREMVFSTQADAAGACIRIEDDGKGFAGEAGATGGHGLRNIRYRAALLGASVRWQARATADGGPAGTCFTFLLPLAAPAATVADPH